MFEFFKKKKTERAMGIDGDQETIIAVHTQPLLINPDFDASLKQKLFRMDAIERYVTQRKEEKRPIPAQRMQELTDDYERLKIEIRQMKARFVADGGSL